MVITTGELGCPADTTLEAHRMQREVYRRMDGTARLAIAFELSDLVRRFTMAGIRDRHPGYSDEQVQRAWARLILGDDLTRAAWPHRALVDP
jgi:hypothetical protein